MPDPYQPLVKAIDSLATEAIDLRNARPTERTLASKDVLLLGTTILSATQGLVDAIQNNTAALKAIATAIDSHPTP
jgi:hypothetical protein